MCEIVLRAIQTELLPVTSSLTLGGPPVVCPPDHGGQRTGGALHPNPLSGI